MKRSLFASVNRLFLALCLSATPCFAEVWTVATSYAEAVQKAKSEGKLILADFGQTGCSDCEGMENLFHNTSLGISQKIQATCVYWWANYRTPDATPWTRSLGGVALPYIYYLDPGASAGSALSTSSGLISGGNVLLNLKSVGGQLPLSVTNLSGAILTSNSLHNGKLTLGGLARTNSMLVGSIRGATIANVMWRVREDGSAGGDFTPVNRLGSMNDAFKYWGSDFVPRSGTNAFESYVLYSDGSTSWTNIVRFLYEGEPGPSPLTVTLSWTTNYLSQGASTNLTAQISGGSPPYSKATFEFAATDFSSSVALTYSSIADVTPSSGIATITLPNVSNSQMGRYRVIVSDSATDAMSSPASLAVCAPATISSVGTNSLKALPGKMPEMRLASAVVAKGALPFWLNQEVMAGSNATFSVGAYGYDLTYQWQKDGIPLTNTIDGHINGATSNTLVITRATNSDQGLYSVQIVNCYVLLTNVGNLTVISGNSQTDTNPPPLVASTSKTDAIARALYEGKMILADFGNSDCGNCAAMEAILHSTRVRQWVQASCVLWTQNVTSAEAQIYVPSGNVSLPLLCFIDPNQAQLSSSNVLAFKEGLLSDGYALATMIASATNLPLVVTNLPGIALDTNALTNGKLMLGGLAFTNSPILLSVRGVAVNKVMWRLSGGSFIPATRLERITDSEWSWAAEFAPQHGTNTFESFVEYEGGQNSWTNRVQFIYLGRASQTITFASLPPKTYGDASFALTAAADSGLPIGYASDNPSVARISGSTVTIVAAGSANLTASQSGNDSYTAATPVTQTLTASKATLTVTADNKSRTYGTANPMWTATITGFVNGDTRGTSITGSPEFNATATSTNGASNYPIAVARGTLTSTNYSFGIFTEGTLTVTPATLTVKADNQHKTPGTANPPLTYTITGFVNGDLHASAVTGNPDLRTTATTGSGPGDYPITVARGSLEAANYGFAAVNGMLTVGDNLPPVLSVTSHTNLQVVATNKITLAGTACDAGQGDGGIKLVTVNGLSATNGSAANTATANWSRGLSLSAGTNTLRIVSSDNASTPNAVTNVIRIISDPVRPTLRIVTPTANQRWSNNVFAVRGVAADNLQLAEVWCKTNGVWGLISTGGNGSNWTVSITLTPGTNTIMAYAVDVAGNCSITNAATITYIATDRLTLITHGNGTVSPNYSNATLEVGKRYTITATPATGCLFSNWVGSVAGNIVISSNGNSLSFLMASNLMLQASFVSNPFIAAQGTYNGLYFPVKNSYLATNAAVSNSGYFVMTLGRDGSYSGNLLLAGSTLRFTGKFNLEMLSDVIVARGKSPLRLGLRLNPSMYDEHTDVTQTNVVTGMVSEEGHWQSDLCSYRNATGNSNPYTGNYTLLIAGCHDWGLCFGDGYTDLPGGDGAGTVNIGRGGSVQLAGTLADGTAFGRNATATEQGYCPLYVPLYGNRGFLLGWVNLRTNQFASSVTWLMPPSLPGHFNTNGFTHSRTLWLTRYSVPSNGQLPVNWTNAIVEITGGNLPQPDSWGDVLRSQIALSNSGVRVISGSISNLSMGIKASNGLFTGTFVNPVNNRVTSFTGALLADPETPIDAGGWWLDTHGQSGNIRIKSE